MPKSRILTQSERLVIVRKAANGVGKQQLAQCYGVKRRTIDYTINRKKTDAVTRAFEPLRHASQ